MIPEVQIDRATVTDNRRKDQAGVSKQFSRQKGREATIRLVTKQHARKQKGVYRRDYYED